MGNEELEGGKCIGPKEPTPPGEPKPKTKEVKLLKSFAEVAKRLGFAYDEKEGEKPWLFVYGKQVEGGGMEAVLNHQVLQYTPKDRFKVGVSIGGRYLLVDINSLEFWKEGESKYSEAYGELRNMEDKGGDFDREGLKNGGYQELFIFLQKLKEMGFYQEAKAKLEAILEEEEKTKEFFQQFANEVLAPIIKVGFPDYKNTYFDLKSLSAYFYGNEGFRRNKKEKPAVGFQLCHRDSWGVGKDEDAVEQKFGWMIQDENGVFKWSRHYISSRDIYTPYTVAPPDSMQPKDEARCCWHFKRGNLEDAWKKMNVAMKLLKQIQNK